MSALVRRSDRPDGEAVSPLAKWCAAALVVTGVVAVWRPWERRGPYRGPGPVDMGPIVTEFRDDLAAVLAEEPANADRLRDALARIDRESDRWKGYATENAVMKLKSDLATKLAAVSGPR